MPEPKVLLMIGLPRSGKSTLARQASEQFKAPIVCADAIRLALHGRRFVHETEDIVHAMTKYMVKALLIAGHECVIVDECHITEKLRAQWQSKYWRLGYVFVNTPPSECIRRAHAQNDQYIIPVINRMAGQWEDPKPEEFDPTTILTPLPACGGPEGRTQ